MRKTSWGTHPQPLHTVGHKRLDEVVDLLGLLALATALGEDNVGEDGRVVLDVALHRVACDALACEVFICFVDSWEVRTKGIRGRRIQG